MSIRQGAFTLLFAASFWPLASVARAQNAFLAAAKAGYAEASDVGFSGSQQPDAQADQSSPEAIAAGGCSQRNSGGNCSCSDCGCGSACRSNCGCESTCDCGDDCQHPWHWAAGAEGTYLSPNFHHDASFGPGTRDILDMGWQAAPRIWLGVESCSGWGVRARYWQFDDDRNRFGLLLDTVTSGTAVVDASQQLKAYDIDCELTRRLEVGRWNFVGSFGGRYASLDRLFMADALAPGVPAQSEFFSAETQTNAGGITGAIEMSTPLGIGGLEVFGILRASPMWGRTGVALNAREIMNGIPLSFSDLSHVTAQMTVWEAQVGLQCSKDLACCQGTVFARCAFEYQSWNVSDLADFTDPSVDMYGVAFAIGFAR